MLPLFSGLKILSFSSSLSHFAATYFVLSITMPLKLQTLLHKSLIFFNEEKKVDVIVSSVSVLLEPVHTFTANQYLKI